MRWNTDEPEKVPEQSVEDKLAVLIGTPAGRRLMSSVDPEWFDIYYCSMVKAPHRTAWLERIDTEIKAAKVDHEKRKLLFLAPRDHGKTEAGITVVTREICMNRDIRILWVAVALDSAKKRVNKVKRLLGSEKIVADWTTSPETGYGPFKASDSDKWTETQLYVSRKRNSVDPTLEAVGSGGSVTGGHFDLIVFDDVEDDRTCNTAATRQKTRAWFRGTILPMLSRGGALVVIGTKKHHDDLYDYLEKDGTFKTIKDPALFIEEVNERGGVVRTPVIPEHKFRITLDDYGKEMITGVDVTDTRDVKALWPDPNWRDVNYLLTERHSMGSIMFNREFQHIVMDDASTAFKRDWLIRAANRGSKLDLYDWPEAVNREGAFTEVPCDLEIVQGWDLALITSSDRAEAKDGDYTVGITWAIDRNTQDRYLLGIARKRGLTPVALREFIVAEYMKFAHMGMIPTQVAVEKNNFGELHYYELSNAVESHHLPLVAHLTTHNRKTDAWEGVASLSRLFDNNKVVFPSQSETAREKVQVLMDELYELGKSRHDDCVMALWIAESVLRPPPGGQSTFGKSRSFIKERVGSSQNLDNLDSIESQEDGTYLFSSKNPPNRSKRRKTHKTHIDPDLAWLRNQ